MSEEQEDSKYTTAEELKDMAVTTFACQPIKIGNLIIWLQFDNSSEVTVSMLDVETDKKYTYVFSEIEFNDYGFIRATRHALGAVVIAAQIASGEKAELGNEAFKEIKNQDAGSE